jgi:hypothetical protein
MGVTDQCVVSEISGSNESVFAANTGVYFPSARARDAEAR